MTATENSELEDTFFKAVRSGNVEKVQAMVGDTPALLQGHDCHGFGGTPLNLAVFKMDREMIDTLLDLGADPNSISDWDAGPWNAVQCALNAGHDALAEYFVKRGATIGVHEAAGLGRISELRALLDEDPNSVHRRGGDGCLPLHFAGSKEVVDLLAERGANLDARDVDHFSTAAQYLAKNRPEVARYLFQLGAAADIFSAILADDRERVQKLIQDDPTVLDQRINQETFPPGAEEDVHNVMTFVVGGDATPFHAAASAGRLEMMDVLLQAGMSVDVRGGYDESTALHMAAWNDALAVAQYLIKAGANLDLRSGSIHNNTAAGWAIVAGSADVFCLLMDEGATELEHFKPDAEKAVRGEFRQYKVVNSSNYDRIKARLAS